MTVAHLSAIPSIDPAPHDVTVAITYNPADAASVVDIAIDGTDGSMDADLDAIHAAMVRARIWEMDFTAARYEDETGQTPRRVACFSVLP